MEHVIQEQLIHVQQSFRASLVDVAWAAGLIEGEGCFSLTMNKGKAGGRPRAQMCVIVQSTDEDVLLRLRGVLGFGNVRQATAAAPRRKAVFRWQMGRRDEVLTMIGALWPFLGERRREQIRVMVVGWRNDKTRPMSWRNF